MTATAIEPTTAHTPKRWPIHPEVIDSPACAMPQYATYPTRYFLVSGSTIEVSADTLDEILDKGTVWARPGSRIVRVPLVPYFETLTGAAQHRAVGKPAAPGGTWSGHCGSAIWVNDAHDLIAAFRVMHALGDPARYIQDFVGQPSGYMVDTLQAWWVNGCADNHPELDGFFIECFEPHRHLGPCTALDRNWNWRDYAPWTDQGHNTQLSLF